jgi:hypothetical protein
LYREVNFVKIASKDKPFKLIPFSGAELAFIQQFFEVGSSNEERVFGFFMGNHFICKLRGLVEQNLK